MSKMTFEERRFRVIARRASRTCETRTVGHGKTDRGQDFWSVVPWSRSAVETVVYWAVKEAVALDRKRRGVRNER